jgi:hypothetical protein
MQIEKPSLRRHRFPRPDVVEAYPRYPMQGDIRPVWNSLSMEVDSGLSVYDEILGVFLLDLNLSLEN